ncbi:MAG: ATP-binding protein [Candidatus Jordarchaeum sp.]|uniref:ATP-binding protein n=1 Tax=Candidatus Jordarchaeum sp. TaxID=2823881 RepID=UPI00404A810C
MCRYCVKWGGGTKWYLNPKNYSDEMLKSELTKPKLEDTMAGDLLGIKGTIQEIMTSVQRFRYDIGFGEALDAVFPDLHDEASKAIRGALPDLVDMAVGGQAVPLEDALKIVDLNEGDIFVLPCVCRKYYGGKEKLSCMFLRPAGKGLSESLGPWDKPNKWVSKKEAKEMLKELDKEGTVHAVFWCPAPIPTMICNCEYPICIALRARLNYDVEDTFRKAEYVSEVDPNACDGCDGTPKCTSRCTFGAIKYSPTAGKVSINPFQCWGCGVCRPVCPHNAISLSPREEVAQVKDVW